MQAGEEKGIQARVINLVCEDEDGILIEDHIRDDAADTIKFFKQFF